MISVINIAIEYIYWFDPATDTNLIRVHSKICNGPGGMQKSISENGGRDKSLLTSIDQQI